tara:strand:+ start:806 stop:1222 length:417 start_codon:yes stop_codon:yes gene_type:complete
MKIVYDITNGLPVHAYQDPKEPGRFALPANSVEIEPPSFDQDTQTCSFDGTEWVVANIPIPEPDPEQEPIPAMDQLRMQRNYLLSVSDWRMNEDYPYSDKEDWKVYRQELRDLPANSSPELNEDGQLTNVVWPTTPGS